MFFEFLLYCALLLLLLCVAGLVSDGHAARAAHRLVRLARAGLWLAVWLAGTGLWLAARTVKDLASAMYHTDGLTARGTRVVNALDTLALSLRVASERLDRLAWRINPNKKASA